MAESSDVEFEFLGVEVHVPKVFNQHVNAVLSLSARGHLVPSEIQVEASRELLARAARFTLDLVNVERLEGHRPAGEEVELRQVFCEQVRIFSVDVVTPFNGPALFFDDANGVVVFNAGKGKFRHDDFHGFLALLGSVSVDGGDEILRFFFLCHGFPDVVEHALKHTHHVVIVGPRTLDVEGDELGEVAVRVAFFGSKRRTDFENALQAAAHAQLLEELRRLIEESGAVKILHGEQIGTPLGGGGDDFRSVGFEEPFGNQVFSAKLEHLPTQSEHGVDMRPAEVQEAVVEAGVQLHVDAVGDAQRERGFGASDDVDSGGQHFVSGWGRRLAFLHLWRALEGHGAGELQG